MKKQIKQPLILALIILTVMTVVLTIQSFAEDAKRYGNVISIVIISDTPENQRMFNETGQVVAKPIPHPNSVLMFARTGAICDVFGHRLDIDKCLICLKPVGSIKKRK